MSVDVKVAAQRAEARIGSVIKDKWQLDRLLGVGGMACVYAATHRNKKRAALKMLHRELSSDPAIRERFLREGYLANSVGHRGAVAVDDDDVAEDGSAFIVMELLDGETLDQRWRRKGKRLPLDEVLAVADQVLDTLAAAHERGVVHRDLKPENLFLTRDGVVKLLDFGIGRLKEMKGLPSTTLSGAAMGTPAFMAPEQARGRWDEVDGQTDLWALGATLFTLLCGEYVHESETVNETLALACTQPARSVKVLRPDLPQAAAALVDRALQYSKPQRFADARAMQAQLRLVYAELSGRDVTQAAQLSVPDGEPSAVSTRPPLVGPAIVGSEETDPRLRLTTARGVSASELPAPLRVSLALRGRRAWWLGAGAAAALGALLVAARSCSQDSVEVAAVPPASASAVHAASAPPPAVLAASALPALPASATAPVLPIDALPRERRKRTGEPRPPVNAATPAKKDDPFARRR
jgi:eukaryotic-like serine/threonine-protein kinase